MKISPKSKARHLITQFKKLQGDPHYIATGMAIGVGVAITPTIPFHTIIAIALAIVLRGSKPAAAIGVWFSNPVTIPIFYIASYEVGMILMGSPDPQAHLVADLLHTLESNLPFSEKCVLLINFLKEEMEVFYAMLIGGFVLSIPPGIASYFITLKIIMRMRGKKPLRLKTYGADPKKQ